MVFKFDSLLTTLNVVEVKSVAKTHQRKVKPKSLSLFQPQLFQVLAYHNHCAALGGDEISNNQSVGLSRFTYFQDRKFLKFTFIFHLTATCFVYSTSSDWWVVLWSKVQDTGLYQYTLYQYKVGWYVPLWTSLLNYELEYGLYIKYKKIVPVYEDHQFHARTIFAATIKSETLSLGLKVLLPYSFFKQCLFNGQQIFGIPSWNF